MANAEYDRYAYSAPVAEADSSDDDVDAGDEIVDETEEIVEEDRDKEAGEDVGEEEVDREAAEEEIVEEVVESPPPRPSGCSPFFRDTAAGIQRLTQPAPRQRPDDMSDLFRVTKADVFGDTTDLTSVDIEHDVLDTDPDGSFDSVLTVTSEDIMGPLPQSVTREREQERHRQRRVRRVISPYRRAGRYPPPPSQMGGVGR